MSAERNSIQRLFMLSALIMLLAGLLFGLLSAMEYVFPAWLRPFAGFEKLRPMHVSAVLFWILLGATACVYGGLEKLLPASVSQRVMRWQWALWLLAIAGVLYSYAGGRFGGREYWEFDPVWALPIGLSWLLFLFNFFKAVRKLSIWPVYIWMWMTGIVFFIFTFIENYLWVFPFFRERMITDMTIQWKANGSLVGAWNQLLYGTAFFLMERIGNGPKTGRSRMAFAMYFLGLFNLMFNWGHHIYTLPTAPYIRHIAYAVSMTEWIFFIRILYQWRKQVSEAKRLYHYYPYRFLMAADFWVFVNMGQAILMSVPALNLYTHGTHVTVAHAMGTTIGINSMILLAAAFEFLPEGRRFGKGSRLLNPAFWSAQISLFFFWLTLNAAGLYKGFWQMKTTRGSYAALMSDMSPFFIVLLISGFFLMCSLAAIAIVLLRTWFSNFRVNADAGSTDK